MARGGKNKHHYKRKSQRPNRPPSQRDDVSSWKKHIGSEDMRNKKMEVYYSSQPGIFTDEKDQEAFFDALRRPLPASFRIGADVPQAFTDNLTEELMKLTSVSTELELKKLSFVSNSYQFNSLDRKAIRRKEHLSEFHSWLVTNTTNGFITRQETVSMLPPVVLGVEPHHKVLDMCAAPGSKTAQMLETIAQSQQGLIVANDADAKRAYMLTRQLRRLNSPNIFICSVDARFFPNVTKGDGYFDRVLCDVPCGGDGTVRKNPQIWRNWQNNNSMALHPVQLSIAIRGLGLTKIGGYMCYSTCSINPIENEAVVCELLRKFSSSIRLVDVKTKFDKLGFAGRTGLTKWKVLCEKSTRKSQKRRQQMEEWKSEKEDKTNANENESEQTGNKEEIETNVDDESEPSETDLFNKHYNEYDTIGDVPPNNQKIHKSMFPPSSDSEYPLQYCMRVHPQDNDTGGFFVALFEKIGQLDFENSKEKVNDNTSNVIEESSGDSEGIKSLKENTDLPDDSAPAAKKSKINDDVQTDDVGKEGENGGVKQNVKPRKVKTDLGNLPFIPVDSDSWNIIWPELRDFYGLTDSSFPAKQVKARADGETKCLYFATEAINETLLTNDFQKRVVVINTGLKIFSKNTKQSNARYRLNQEGVHCIIPFMDDRRKVFVELKDYSLLVDKALFLLQRNRESAEKSNNLNIYLEHCANEEDEGNEGKTETILDQQFSTSFVEGVRKLDGIGSFVVILNGHENDILNSKMAMVFWKCRQECINILVAKDEIEGIQSKLRAL